MFDIETWFFIVTSSSRYITCYEVHIVTNPILLRY